MSSQPARTGDDGDRWTVSRSKQRSAWVRELCAEVLTIWEEARRHNRPHSWILARRAARIHGSPYWRRITAGERAEIEATFRACSDMAWRRDLVWRLGPATGPLPEDQQGIWGDGSVLSTLARQRGALYGGHYWAGTDQVFGEYACSNPNAPASPEPASPEPATVCGLRSCTTPGCTGCPIEEI